MGRESKIYKNKQERIEQEQFRRDLINKYGKFIIEYPVAYNKSMFIPELL